MMLLINVIASDGNRLNPLAIPWLLNNSNNQGAALVVYNQAKTLLYYT
jgi:hypothetical protein